MPRLAFLQDLCLAIEEFKKEGDHIILLIVGNEDTRRGGVKKHMESCQLRVLTLNRHRSNAPSTYHRNNNKVFIDGIWVTAGINIMSGCYFDFDKVFSNKDHRTLWIKITYVTAFGHNMPPIAKPATRRLHCKDPRLLRIISLSVKDLWPRIGYLNTLRH